MGYGLSENELFMLISGRLGPRLSEAPELAVDIARAVAVAIDANNRKIIEQAHAEAQAQLSKTQQYDRLSQSIDCY